MTTQRIISLSVTPTAEDEEFVFNALNHAAVQIGHDCPDSTLSFSRHSYEEDEFDVEPAEELHHDEDTLDKVRNALIASGMTGKVADNAINEMQNRGILFRERPR